MNTQHVELLVKVYDVRLSDIAFTDIEQKTVVIGKVKMKEAAYPLEYPLLLMQTTDE